MSEPTSSDQERLLTEMMTVLKRSRRISMDGSPGEAGYEAVVIPVKTTQAMVVSLNSIRERLPKEKEEGGVND